MLFKKLLNWLSSKQEELQLDHWDFALDILEHMNDDIYTFIEYLMTQISIQFGVDRIAFFAKDPENEQDFIVRLKIGTGLPDIGESYPLSAELNIHELMNQCIIEDPKSGEGFDLYLVLKRERLGSRRHEIEKQELIGVIALDDTSSKREFTLSQRRYFYKLAKIFNKMLAEHGRNFELIYIDPLTRVFARKYLEEKGFELFLFRKSVAMADVDHFKKVNDTYGHKTGDIVLTALGKFLKSSLRSSDIIIRYGGEEFVLILAMDIETAKKRLDEMLVAFSKIEFQHSKGNFYCTISIGVVSIPAKIDDYKKIVDLADSKLYQAKNSGRNRVIVG